MGEANVYKWALIDRASIAVINLATNIVLARMLLPADFGLLAMIAIFIAVASDFTGTGMVDSLIHKPKPTEMDYSTVFVFNCTMGLMFGLAFFFGAPLVARFFGHEELVGVMRVLGVCFFFQSMGYVQDTRMRKQLKMRSVCFVRVGATLTVSALGILLAWRGYGYWALVCTQIGFLTVVFFYYLIAARWFPRLQFSWTTFKNFFSYGIHLMFAFLSSIICENVNTFVLGRFYASPRFSGVYYQGAKLANVPYGIISTSLNSSFFVVASNEEDESRRMASILRMTGVMLSIAFNLLFLLMAVSGPVILFLVGEKWEASIPVFRILLVGQCLWSFRSYLMMLCKVFAHTVFIRNVEFVVCGVQLALLGIFFRYGILWIAATQVAGMLFAVAVYVTFCCRHRMGFGFRQLWRIVVRELWQPAVAFVVAGAVAVALPVGWPAFVHCVVITLAYGVTVLALGAAFNTGVYVFIKDRIKFKRTE